MPSVAAGRPPALFRGVDRAAFAVALSRKLQAGGVPVGLSDMQSFAKALATCPPRSTAELRWLARITLVRRHDDLAVFDRVFQEVFGAVVPARDPHARMASRPLPTQDDDLFASLQAAAHDEVDGGGLPWATLPRITGPGQDDGPSPVVPERLPSRLQGFADTPFEDLVPADLALIGSWLEAALQDWAMRRSRRLAQHPAGHRIAVRATLALARRTGGEPLHLVTSRPVDRPRRVLMLCDVSQSMQSSTTAYLHFMRALRVSAGAEVFAFATSLTRLTRVLDHHSPQQAIELAGDKVDDRFGGTRIATNLQALLTSHHGGVLRGAVVLIASDGWDSDPPADLARAMARLRRRAHRVLWLNPRAAAPGFEPLVGSMAAALPHCDELLTAHTLRSLGDVVAAIARR